MATELGEPLVVFALHREAAPFRWVARRECLPVRIVVSGMGRDAARRATAAAIRAAPPPPRLVIASGFCGGLRPGLHIGEVIVTTNVVDLSGAYLPAAGPSGRRILTADRVVGDPAEKRRLHTEYDAEVVDMESAGVFEAVGDACVRKLAVRAVSDAAETALSPHLAELLSGGHVSIRRAAVAVVRHPRLLGEFRRLARDTRIASRALAVRLAEIVR